MPPLSPVPPAAEAPPTGDAAPFEGLDQLLELLGEASSALAGSCETLEEDAARLEALGESAVERAEAASAAVAELGDDLAEARTSVTASLDAWRDASESGLERLELDQQALTDEASRLGGELEQAREATEAAAGEVDQALDDAEQAVTGLDGAVDHAEERLLGAVDATGHLLDDVRYRIDYVAEEVERHTADLADETATTLAVPAAASLEEASGLLEQAGLQLRERLASASQGVTDTFVRVAEHGLEAQQELLTTVADASASVQDFVAGGALDVVSQATDAAISQALDLAAQELAELAATLAAGHGVTAAMAPIFPELAVAKNVAEVINDLLSALPGF